MGTTALRQTSKSRDFFLVLFFCLIGILALSLIHISEPTRRTPISYAVFCLKKKKKNHLFLHYM